MISRELAKQIRERFALPVDRMAKLVGVKRRQWYRYEEGTTAIPLTVEKLLVILLRYEQVRQDALGEKP